MIITTVTDAIGSTPIFKFTEKDYPMPKDSVIYAKLENLNPGGSIKDRLGKYLITTGVKKGKSQKIRPLSNPLPATPVLVSQLPH